MGRLAAGERGEVMGDVQEPALDVDFLLASQQEPSETPVVFQAAQHPLDFHSRRRAQGFSLLREQVLPGLSTHPPQLKTHHELAVGFAASALAARWAAGAVLALMVSPFNHIAALSRVELCP